MQRDYYAFRREMLSEKLDELEQIAERIVEAKIRRDTRARRQAEGEIKKPSKETVEIEPHVAYLWFWAKKQEAEEKRNKREEKRNKREEDIASEAANAVREAWKDDLKTCAILEDLRLIPNMASISDNITHLPPLSFMLHIPFSLQKPYLSKDERVFHLLDNPVRKEKVFQTPMVASTSWKGALRAAMLQQFVEWWSNLDESARGTRQNRKLFVSWRLKLARLFGTEKGIQLDDEKYKQYLDKLGGAYQARWYRRYVQRHMAANGFFAGRLYFYPTFFDKVGLEVINPHDRKTGIGTVPILMECVPTGAKGNLYVLYVPFGSIGQTEIAQDLEVLAEGIKAMLTVYGFGAKTSSGFGMADLQGKGQLVVHYPDESKRPPKPIRPAEPDAVRVFREKYPKYADEDFALGTKDWKEKHSATNSERKAYRDAKAEWQNYTKQLETYQQQQKEWEEAQKAPLPPISASFGNWDKLGEQATRVAEQLRGGEG